MPMRDLPVLLEGYRLTVTEPPEPKLREQDGAMVEATDREGVRLFTVSLFAKLRAAGPGGRRSKGEEIKVTLESDPGEGFEEGTPVALVNPRVSPYAIEGPYGTNAGISFRAAGMAPAGAGSSGQGRSALVSSGARGESKGGE